VQALGQVHAPRRQARSIRNDERVLSSSRNILDQHGWGALAISRVAKEAGLNPSTVAARYGTRASLGAGLWRDGVAAPLLEHFRRLMETARSRRVSARSLHDGLDPFIHPDRTTGAAAELLVVAGFEPTLAGAVNDTMEPTWTRWLTPDRERTTRPQAARHAFLVSMAIGFVLEARRYGGLDLDFSEAIAALARGLSSPTEPTRLPTRRARFLDAPFTFDTGMPPWDAALTATLECVGDLGFDAATIETITAASGYTRAVIFSRYPTKLELFMDATDRMLASRTRAGLEYQLGLEREFGPGIPDACYLRETLRPEHRRLRAIALEQVRLSAHSTAIQRAMQESATQFEQAYVAGSPDATPQALRARLTMEMAVTTGALALAQLHPDIWKLPYDTILTPWAREREAPRE
jgi:AcrR family transcriptional regulator